MTRLKKLSNDIKALVGQESNRLMNDIVNMEIPENYEINFKDDEHGYSKNDSDKFISIYNNEIEAEMIIRCYYNTTYNEVQFEVINEYAHYDYDEYNELIGNIKKFTHVN